MNLITEKINFFYNITFFLRFGSSHPNLFYPITHHQTQHIFATDWSNYGLFVVTRCTKPINVIFGFCWHMTGIMEVCRHVWEKKAWKLGRVCRGGESSVSFLSFSWTHGQREDEKWPLSTSSFFNSFHTLYNLSFAFFFTSCPPNSLLRHLLHYLFYSSPGTSFTLKRQRTESHVLSRKGGFVSPSFVRQK